MVKPAVKASLVTVSLAALFVAFGVRVVYVQTMGGGGLVAQKGLSASGSKRTLLAGRGTIRDANNEVLAGDLPQSKIVADATRLDQIDLAVPILKSSLGVNERELREKLGSNRPYIILKNKVSEQQRRELMARLAAQNIKGIYVEPDYARTYPNGRMLCHTIGFTGYKEGESSASAGVDGIELSMDAYLQARPGYYWTEQDRAGAELAQHRGVEQAPRNGNDVQLCIDMGLQSIVESELDAAVKKYSPETAVAILLRPKTGEILAFANRPDFDLNKRSSALPEQMKHRGIADLIEPGSTFKIVTHAAVLHEKIVRPEDKLFCENGRWEYCNNVLHDSHAYGMLSVHEALVHSSNIGAAKLALQLGEARLHQFIKAFGFGDKTGIELPGEIGGIVHPVRRWSKISITHIPMGQEVGVTPIQLAMAMGAIANEGVLMRPRVIRAITDDNGQLVATFEPQAVRQVVRPEAARNVINALEDVVGPQGTAKGAAVPGFRVAGKTGTAQKPGPHGTYLPGKYIVSFVGFLPAEAPEFVCLVMFNDARTKPGENYGGLVAGPVFSNIAKRAAKYLGLTPAVIDEPVLAGKGASTPASFSLAKQSAGRPPIKR